jgi:Integrase core domain
VIVDQTIVDLAPIVGKRAACAALGRSRATYYRRNRQSPPPTRPARAPRPQPRALSQVERAEILGILHDGRFVDQAPASIYATLLDEGRYVCSVPTMYRVLRAADEVHERRRQAQHPATVKPELVATGPNRIWTWDITKLLGPEKWTYFHLYVMIDIYSRYIPGWLLAKRETAELAEHLPREPSPGLLYVNRRCPHRCGQWTPSISATASMWVTRVMCVSVARPQTAWFRSLTSRPYWRTLSSVGTPMPTYAYQRWAVASASIVLVCWLLVSDRAERLSV